MRIRILAAVALWLLATTGFVTLAMFHGALALVPGALWLVVSLYGLASIGYKVAWLPADRIADLAGRLLRLGLIAPLMARFDVSALENQNRQKILAYLEANPGSSIQDVRLANDVAWGTAVYHLDRLRRQEKVVSHRQGNHHRYWVANTPESRVRRGWSVLEQSTARDIAMAVAAQPGVHQGAICEAVNVRAPSASKHLARLEEHGLVEKFRVSRYTVYQPTEALERILALQGEDHASPGVADIDGTVSGANEDPAEADAVDARDHAHPVATARAPAAVDAVPGEATGA